MPGASTFENPHLALGLGRGGSNGMSWGPLRSDGPLMTYPLNPVIVFPPSLFLRTTPSEKKDKGQLMDLCLHRPKPIVHTTMDFLWIFPSHAENPINSLGAYLERFRREVTRRKKGSRIRVTIPRMAKPEAKEKVSAQ
jgi:hypothetical protein